MTYIKLHEMWGILYVWQLISQLLVYYGLLPPALKACAALFKTATWLWILFMLIFIFVNSLLLIIQFKIICCQWLHKISRKIKKRQVHNTKSSDPINRVFKNYPRRQDQCKWVCIWIWLNRGCGYGTSWVSYQMVRFLLIFIHFFF